jgi:hypothetical protein
VNPTQRAAAAGSKQPMLLALTGTAAMLAHQVAGKAARDGFFLSVFEATDLPKMVVSAAFLSLSLAVLFSRLLERSGPRNLLPLTFAMSAVLHVGEWLALTRAPGPTAVFVYLHIVGLGAVLLSGFWSLLTELFDLREAKRSFGRITGAGTGGGLVGGILAERLVAWTSAEYLLVLLAILHAVCAAVSVTLRPPPAPSRRITPLTSAREAFRRTPLLSRLAVIVFLGTASAAVLDYLFKLGAGMTLGKGPALVRFFAIYYTGAQLVTLLLQMSVSRVAVERLGVFRSVVSLPMAVGAGSAAALLIPVYPLVAAVRAVELILRGSLFRSAYEVLYSPVPPADKRAVKTIVDVGCDRLGDAAGAGAVQVMIWLGPLLARPEILGLAAVLSLISGTVALGIRGAYRGVLARGLVQRAGERQGYSQDRGESLLDTFFDGIPTLETFRPAVVEVVPAEALREAPEEIEPPAPSHEPVLQQLIELRSQDSRRVRKALESDPSWDPILAPQVIRLLAWDEVNAQARAWLESHAARLAGQLTDVLADPDADFSLRRRVPRILARAGTQRSVDGLIQGLNDARFEVRYQCGRALNYALYRNPDLQVAPQPILDAILRELSVGKTIWQSRRLLDERESSGDYEVLGDALRDRAGYSLEHVFTLMALVLPREPLKAAFLGLHQDDRAFRSLALEYLENLLPAEIRQALWIILEETPPARLSSGAAQDRQLLEEIERSQTTLILAWQARKSKVE